MLGKPSLIATYSRLALVLAATLAAMAAAIVPASALDIPTGAPPSPLFGAEPFTQKLLMFEEFGTKTVPLSKAVVSNMPLPDSCDGTPSGAGIDSFLAQLLSPLPQATANTSKPNMWWKAVETCYPALSGMMATSPIEGRPPGEWFSHQRWAEFKPRVYLQTAMTGARGNGGLRDAAQMHRYRFGEFGPNGLYHNTVGAPGFNGTTKGIAIRIHPKMPVQDRNSV
jgi:hypothetical protein